MDRRPLTALFGPGGPLTFEADLADADLLAQFAAGGDGRDAAFAEVVRRHGPAVWAACRACLPTAADAEDAFQATFLAIIRSPRAVRRSSSLPGWLHGVAVRVAAQLRRGEGRRRARDARAALPEGHAPVPDSAWDRTLAAVHEEVARLPQAERAAYLACEVGGAGRAEAARRLGWRPGTLNGTLARAKRRLAARLAARGVLPAAAALAAGAGNAGAVPWRLAEAVNLFPSMPAGAVPAAVSQLATEGLAMGLGKLKAWAGAAVVAGGLAAGVGPAFLPTAGAQGLGGGGAAPVPAPAGEAPRAAPAGAGRGGAPMPGGVAGGGGGLPLGPPDAPKADPQWRYEVADVPATTAAFLKVVGDYGRRGWEYAGLTVCRDGVKGADDPKLLFKRPGGAADARGPGDLPTTPAGQAAQAKADLDQTRALLAALTAARAAEARDAEARRAAGERALNGRAAPRAAEDPGPPPVVFELVGETEGAAPLVPVVEAALDRESAKLGGPVRVAALGRRLLVFGGTPQTAARVRLLLKSLNIPTAAPAEKAGVAGSGGSGGTPAPRE